jgi:hypothetical protein
VPKRQLFGYLRTHGFMANQGAKIIPGQTFPEGAAFQGLAFLNILDRQKFDVMGPGQFARGRAFPVFQIKLAHPPEARNGKSRSQVFGKFCGKFVDAAGAVSGAGFAVLFDLHDVLTGLPVGRGERVAGGIEKPDDVGNDLFVPAGRQFVRHGEPPVPSRILTGAGQKSTSL